MHNTLITLTMMLGSWCLLMALLSLCFGVLCGAWDIVARLARTLLLLCGLISLALLW